MPILSINNIYIFIKKKLNLKMLQHGQQDQLYTFTYLLPTVIQNKDKPIQLKD